MYFTATTLLALQLTLCLSIRVPVVWNNDNSEVNDNKQFVSETIQPQNVEAKQKPIPTEYFEYTAQKPKFASEIAQFHGVQSPQNHYRSYPVKPHTRLSKPELGKHQMMDKEINIFQPYQDYVKKNGLYRTVTPSTTNYEVFHPYKLEEPALKELYQDPVLGKIRNDLLNSKIRLQKHENIAGESDITKSEYLENPEEIDRKKFPHKNVPSPYEIHRPQRRPVYYRHPSVHNQREHVLNQKFRHPWHQNYVKVKPMHYRPVKNHLQRLRQQHALKYDDEHNEYPQVPLMEEHSEPSDGYDIYEKGKGKFIELRNNVDESINEAVQKNRPIVNQKLELNNENDDENDTNTEYDEEEFVPIKNYAQVRRTETTKHLPKDAALEDADTLDEILNAPRLREAIKSTKAQTVYSEEGYEDSAYDHAGEQKHASDHEGHGGFLKQKELSEGKYKTPTFNAKYKNEEGSEYRDQILDGKKWKDKKKDTDEEVESEEYAEIEEEYSNESDYHHKPTSNKANDDKNDDKTNDSSHGIDEHNERIKRGETLIDNSKKESEHDVNKREVEIEVPKINLTTTYLTEKEILKLSKLKVLPTTDDVAEKYPYYFKNLKAINKDSPLRYAENLDLIPKKSEGGTEFYDSRSNFECPEVEDNIDPLPSKLKKDGHPDEDEEGEGDDIDNKKKDKADFRTLDEKPRLRGLGDKIDCFKTKYFGENPLDSPFFKEEIISKPEPVTVPSLDIYKLKEKKEKLVHESKLNEATDLSKQLKDKSKIDMFVLLDKLYPKQINVKNSIPTWPQLNSTKNQMHTEKHISTTVRSIFQAQSNLKVQQNTTNVGFQEKENKTQLPLLLRKKRAAPFVYEPYKIIRDSQVQDSKKTTTSNNISPLIKQLQSSRVADIVTNNKEQIVKRNAATRTYKDIGKTDRVKNVGKEKGSEPVFDGSFVDVSVDQRRGEPRYELRPVNHKSHYTPVDNKKSMSAEDYKSHTNTDIDSEDYGWIINKKDSSQNHKITTRPYFDVTKFIPQTEEKDKKETLKATLEVKKEIDLPPRSNKSLETNESEEDYDDEYDDDDNDEHTTTTTTTTTKKTPPRRRIATTTTTVRPKVNVEVTTGKLRLVTRFRDSYHTEKPKIRIITEKPTTKVYDDREKIVAPKYREKKKKTTKSTLVTDTKSYGGDDDDDLKKEEVDAMIGVKQDIKEYMPMYEKVDRKKGTASYDHPKSQDVGEYEQDHDHEENDDEHNDDEEDDDDDDEDDDDDDDDDDDIDDDEDEENENEKLEAETSPKLDVTTTEPTKRTLARTTEVPVSTTETHSARLEVKPVVLRKKIEIHKELPANRSSPHITEFKQDIKEVEIIKEIPSKTKKKPEKNIEALELYKDENLAKDVNKLGGVEIFKEDLDLVNGPKHGGNYRSAEILKDESQDEENLKSSKGDVVASQSKTSKLIEVKRDPYSRRLSDIQRARNNRGRNARLIELSDSNERSTTRPMHGGNFKSIYDERRRGGGRNAKIIELDDHDSREDHSTNTDDGNFKSHGSRSSDRHHMHGGNYRSAKIVQAENTENETPGQIENLTKNKDVSKDGRNSAARVLSSFASAVPVLTTTPAYILDPSKRMYYYVDA